MREITDHKSNGLNNALLIRAFDERGAGGANIAYRIDLPGESPTIFQFQNGSVALGFNGISNEALIAIVIDRLRGFQGPITVQQTTTVDKPGSTATAVVSERLANPFACKENACALTHLEEALMWLQKRTRDRTARGVEGTYAK